MVGYGVGVNDDRIVTGDDVGLFDGALVGFFGLSCIEFMLNEKVSCKHTLLLVVWMDLTMGFVMDILSESW